MKTRLIVALVALGFVPLLRAQLPAPWQAQDIGTFSPAGTSSYSAGTFTISAAGVGPWFTSDQFTFVYQAFTGDGSITAHVASIQDVAGTSWEHGGVMFRETLNPNSTYYGVYETPATPGKGIIVESRTTTGGSAAGAGADTTSLTPYWIRLVRQDNLFTAYRSSNGTTWTQVGTPQTIAMAQTIYVGLAVSSEVPGTPSTVTFDNVSVTNNLPAPWSTADIGTVGAIGSASQSSGTWTIAGSGVGPWFSADSFRYVWQPFTGDGSITARVASIQDITGTDWEHGGVMFRESLDPAATFYGVYETPSTPAPGRGIIVEARTTTAAAAIHSGADTTSITPYWVRLVRAGSLFTAYRSSNGTTWTAVGTPQTITMAANAYVGLVASSEVDGTISTVVLDNVSTIPAPTVAITAPADGANVSATIAVTASASGAGGIVGVQFKLDGVNLGAEDTSAPYTINWDTTTVSNAQHVLTAVARDGAGNVTTSAGVLVTVNNTSLPAGWSSQDIGAVGAPGSASYSSGTFTISGAGVGPWSTADEFRFTWVQLTGDCTATAHVVSVQNVGQQWAHGGVMIRESLAVGSAFAGLYETPASPGRGIIYEERASTNATATGPFADPSAVTPYWLRLSRIGNVFTSFRSSDGINWTQIGTTRTIPMAAAVLVGLAVSSEVDATAGTAVFDNVAMASGGYNPPPPSNPNSYAENFDDNLAQNWTATAGSWSASSGVYSTATTGTHTSVYTTTTWAQNYLLRFSLRSNVTGASAKSGALFNYVDANNYYKVLLAADGSAQLIKRIGGAAEATVASVAANSYSGYNTGSGTNPWVEVEIERLGTSTTIRANGSRLFSSIAQTELAAGGIGLTDSGNTSSFDNVSVTPIPTIIYSEDLGDNLAQNWSAVTGTWAASGNTYNNTANGAHDMAVYGSATYSTNYTYSVSVKSTLTGASNKLGAVYNYANSSNYYEVLLGGTGTAEIRKTIAGVTTSQGTASYVGGGANRWSEITILRSGDNTTVNVNGRRVFTNVSQPQSEIASGEIGVVTVTNNVAKFDDITVWSGLYPYKRTFPHIGGLYIGGTRPYDQASVQQTIAKRDLTLLGMYKGFSKNGKNPTQIVNEIKALNPALIVGDYTNAMECDDPSAANSSTYDIWTQLNAGLGPVGGAAPNDWWAYNASNTRMSEYSGTSLINVTYFTRPDANGWRTSQWIANRSATQIFNGPAYDFIFSDNAFFRPRPWSQSNPAQMDWDRNGVNDSSDDLTVRANWRKGMATYYLKFTQLQPWMHVMGNTDGQATQMLGYARDAEYSGLLGGGMMESAMGFTGGSAESWSGWDNTMDNYAVLMDNTRAPNFVMFCARGNADGTPDGQPSMGQAFPAGYAFMRYAIASALMENGYLMYNDGSGYDVLVDHWFDEFDQFLGHAIDGPVRSPTWTSGAAAGAYMRKFQNGAAIVNPRLNPPAQNYSNRTTVTIDLTGQGYKRFTGTQDSATNNGAVVTTFNLAPGDGLILIKQ